jgi:hypothetical protein
VCPNGAVGIPFPYPNPVKLRPFVRLRFDLCRPAAAVRLKIVTTAFRTVIDRNIGPAEAGLYDVELPLKDSSGKALANGFYYVFIETDKGRSMGKLIVVL